MLGVETVDIFKPVNSGYYKIRAARNIEINQNVLNIRLDKARENTSDSMADPPESRR
jgi:hypothetical protein